jgi:hypothetical protein
MSYEAQESYSIRKMAIGLKKQTTYGTKLLDASYVHTPRFEPGAFAEIAAEFYSDGDKAGKGHNYPITHKRIAQASSFQADFDLTDFLALWLGTYHFGAVANSGVNPYTHLMTYLTSTNIMPVTSIYFEDTADVKRHLVDLAIPTLKISGTDSGPLKASAASSAPVARRMRSWRRPRPRCRTCCSALTPTSSSATRPPRLRSRSA